MTDDELYQKLNEVFSDVFDDETLTVSAETTAADVEGWDSLEHINLINAVEQEFGVKFSMGQIVSMKKVGDMVDIIRGQLA